MIQRLEQTGEPGCVGADCIAGLFPGCHERRDKVDSRTR
jgi:hypothetical protein